MRGERAGSGPGGGTGYPDRMDESLDPLAPLAALPGVADAVVEARDAVAAVHRHRANLRKWGVTSAEGGLRGARASAGLEGADVTLPEDGDVGDAVLAGALRVSGELGRAADGWRKAPLQVLARLHLVAAAGLVDDVETLGRPRGGRGVAERLTLLADLVAGGTSVDAPVLAAVVHGEIASLRPFGVMDGVLARAASRLVGISTGLDPHDLGVPEVYWWRRAEEYRARLAGFGEGTPEGVAEWIRFHCAGLVDGAREATSIADAVG